MGIQRSGAVLYVSKFNDKISPTMPASAIQSSLPILMYLCANSRQDEREQFAALTFTEYDPEVAAVGFWSAGKWALACLHPDGTPAAAGGYEQVQPGVWQSWMVGTDRGWKEMSRDIHRTTRYLTEQLVNSGLCRRLQTNALASRVEAHAWYERLGLIPEGIMRGFGAGGEDVAMFGRVISGPDTEVL